MKISKLCIIASMTVCTTFAQNKIKESAKISMAGKIETMKVVPGGILLTGTSEGLEAIEAHKNTVLYKYTTLGKIKPEELTIMDNLPYVILTRGYSKTILNYFTGQEVFNPVTAGWNFVSSVTPDFTNQKIYMLGMTKLGYSFGVFDMQTLQNEGTVAFSDKKKMGAYIDVTRYYESDGKLFVRTEKGIVCIDKTSFKIDWAYDDLGKISQYIKVLVDKEKGLFFVSESDGNKSFLHKIDASGNRTTKNPIKLEAIPQAISFTKAGLLCQMTDGKKSYFQMYDVQNAANIWEKPVDIRGGLFLAKETPTNFIYASNDGLINSLDLNSGKEQLKNEIKTGMWFKSIDLLENDLAFFITSTNMGIANLKTGEYAKEPVKFKKATNMVVAFDKNNDRYIVSSGTELFFLKSDGSATKVMDLDFKEDETPSKIDFRPNGILLSAKQTNVLISNDGKLIYESYYKAPGQSILGKVAMIAVTAAAVSAGNASTNAGYGTINENMKGANGMLGEISKRFSASKESDNFRYVLTKLDDGIGLVKINKEDGKKLGEIILKDKKPVYEVDDDFGILYYKNDDKQITTYDLR